MHFDAKNPARGYFVGVNGDIEIQDCGSMDLAPCEQVTFVTDQGGEYDVTRTAFGFYATPSLDKRLPQFGLHPVLIRNKDTRNHFVLLVEEGKEEVFERYLSEENLEIVIRLDDQDVLESLSDRAGGGGL